MQPKVAEGCRLQLSAALGGLVQPCAPLGIPSQRLRAPKGSHSCTTPPHSCGKLRSVCSSLQLWAASSAWAD
eukprot:14863748-Alexandrium_andersonii.AAC.1